MEQLVLGIGVVVGLAIGWFAGQHRGRADVVVAAEKFEHDEGLDQADGDLRRFIRFAREEFSLNPR